VLECLGTGSYLGLPSMIGRKKKVVFKYLKDTIWKKINHWFEKHLSIAGPEVLVKVVAQAILTFCMSFLMPTSLFKEIQSMLNSFWWGSNRSMRRGINWLTWDKLAVRKGYGGMGFCHLLGFNLVMLAKQGWKLVSDPNAIIQEFSKLNTTLKGCSWRLL